MLGSDDETIARIGATGARQNVQTTVELDRKVLRAVNREVDIPPKQRAVDRVREIRGAPGGPVPVAARVDRDGFEPHPRRGPGEPGEDPRGLDSRQPTPAGPDPKPLRHGSSGRGPSAGGNKGRQDIIGRRMEVKIVGVDVVDLDPVVSVR